MIMSVTCLKFEKDYKAFEIRKTNKCILKFLFSRKILRRKKKVTSIRTVRVNFPEALIPQKYVAQIIFVLSVPRHLL